MRTLLFRACTNSSLPYLTGRLIQIIIIIKTKMLYFTHSRRVRRVWVTTPQKFHTLITVEWNTLAAGHNWLAVSTLQNCIHNHHLAHFMRAISPPCAMSSRCAIFQQITFAYAFVSMNGVPTLITSVALCCGHLRTRMPLSDAARWELRSQLMLNDSRATGRGMEKAPLLDGGQKCDRPVVRTEGVRKGE